MDKFSVKTGMCEADCNFDADISVCQWENIDTDDFDWSVSRGSLKSFTGPTRDQSTSVSGGSAGGYAFIDSAYPRRPGDLARLRMSRPMTTEVDSPMCLSFYVNMFGADIGSLSVLLVQSDDSEQKLWYMERPASSPRDMWHRAQVTVASQQEVRVVLEAKVGDTDRSDIAIDTVRLTRGPCVTMPESAALNTYTGCSFNTGQCGYLTQNIPALADRPSTSSSEMWSRVRGGVGRLPSGHYHPGEEDWFMSFNVRDYSHRPLDRGYLLGPQVPVGSDPLCVGFWVYMATDVASVPYLGSLRLILIPRNTTGQVDRSAEPKVLMSLVNQQESQWFYSQASFTPTVPYLIVFEGTRANNNGIIGVDDVTLFSGQCGQRPAKSITDTRDCSFEFDTCGWIPMNPGSALASDLRLQDWRIADRNTNLNNMLDHTFNLESRGYAYFNTINIQTKTWLVSPLVDSNEELCLQFWYKSTGQSSSSSNLIVRRQFSNGTMGEMVTLSTITDTWSPAMVPVLSLPSQSKIVIEGNSGNGGVAIDDMKVSRLLSLC